MFKNKLNVGDYFKIKPDAVFLNGKSIVPQWTTEKIWQVENIKNDNIIILGNSLDGIKSMFGSPIEIKYVKKVKVK